ncbi:hypothetical protein FRACYDRAFT_240624 [Fragilariopsis cylindrus CCMP1102]|uniref:RING-type E3 ubiquitin transferase BRCA1 n=1 Tax=Fragilariopsis cylindrus CCMP1102 TaxID=635003 RepID=A0A1E7FCQ2_9STRA|nr:hypothetical protein FRACYDRAFT_240624 [Fragilariopsis cylindrus CCMP1102]|eukprot:OEU15929.1 hypothetical protein FRACYDRAFT_240624 [Fragilariopsis cylindrus CCMP1102]
MLSSLVKATQAGIRVFSTPKTKAKNLEEEEEKTVVVDTTVDTTVDSSGGSSNNIFLTTPDGNNKAASGTNNNTNIATPGTASTADITANTTTSSVSMMSDHHHDHEISTSISSSGGGSGGGGDIKRRTVVASSSKKEKDEKSTLKIEDKEEEEEESSDCLTKGKAKKTTATDLTEKEKETQIRMQPPELWQIIDRELRLNIGNSVRCGICLSTVTNPVRTKCMHKFCHDCITGYLRCGGNDPKRLVCPECKTPCTKRSLESDDEFLNVTDAYKDVLRAFSFAPGTYCPEITTMTQKVETFGKNLDDYDSEDDDAYDDESDRARLDRLFVAMTYQVEALPDCHKRGVCSKLQIEETEQVVKANFEACCDGINGNFTFDLNLNKMAVPTKTIMTTNTDTKTGTSKSLLPPPSSSMPDNALPNTQEVQEQAREQLEADREMQESTKEEEEEQSHHNALVEKLESVTEEVETAGLLLRKKNDDNIDFFKVRRSSVHTSDNTTASTFTTTKTNNDDDDDDVGSELFATATQGTDSQGTKGLFATATQGTDSQGTTTDYVGGDGGSDNKRTVDFSTGKMMIRRDRGHNNNNYMKEKKHNNNGIELTSSSLRQPPLSSALLLIGPNVDGLTIKPLIIKKKKVRMTDTGRSNRHVRKSFSKRDNKQVQSSLPITASTSGAVAESAAPNNSTALSSSPSLPFESDSLSPIDHEASFWDDEQNQSSSTKIETIIGRQQRLSSLGVNVTGMVEDSMGGLQMMSMNNLPQLRFSSQQEEEHDDNDGGDNGIAATNDNDDERKEQNEEKEDVTGNNNDGGDGNGNNDETNSNEDRDASANEGSNNEDFDGGGDIPCEDDDGDDDDSDDKTVAMTGDDDQTVAMTGDDEEEDEKNDDEEEEKKENDKDKEGNDTEEKNDKEDNATIVTDELHESTKNEIGKAANLPAGSESKKSSGRRPAKKNLFTTHEDKNNGDDNNDDITMIDQDQDKKPQAKEQFKEAPKSIPSSSSSSSETSKRGTSDNDANLLQVETTSEQGTGTTAIWSKGTIVNVASRTWPGVNKHGGVGRITAMNTDGTYNVSYVLGGKESNVEVCFMTKEDQEEDSGDTSYSAAPARRRRRTKEEFDTLPEDLLRQLAEEGFDTGVSLKSKKSSKKQRKIPAATLSDTTNAGGKKYQGRKKVPNNSDTTMLGTSKSIVSKRKRKNAPTETASVDPSLQETKPSAKKRSTPKAKVEWAKTEGNDVPTRQHFRGSSSAVKSRESLESLESPLDSLLNISKEDAIMYADRRYKQRIQDAITSKSITIVASNLSDDDKAILKTLCTKGFAGDLTIKTTETVTKKTTLCIVPAETDSSDDDNVRASVRTLKVMRSALAGIPIVTSDWLRLCEKENKVVQPKIIVRSLPTKDTVLLIVGDPDYGVAKLAASWSSQQAKAPVLPFQKTCVYLFGSYSPDKRKNIQDLLKEGGAKIVTTAKDVSAKLNGMAKLNEMQFFPYSGRFIIVCGEAPGTLPKSLERDFKAALEGEQHWPSPRTVTVVDSQWVIESVTCAKPLPATSFEPAMIKDLWQLGL